jgi:hypothetical protein
MSQQRFYIQQWDVPSTSGRLDKHGNPVMYRISEAQDGHIIAIRANRGRIEEAITQRQTVRIQHDEQVITIEDGRITGFLEFLSSHRGDHSPVHVH